MRGFLLRRDGDWTNSFSCLILLGLIKTFSKLIWRLVPLVPDTVPPERESSMVVIINQNRKIIWTRQFQKKNLFSWLVKIPKTYLVEIGRTKWSNLLKTILETNMNDKFQFEDYVAVTALVVVLFVGLIIGVVIGFNL